MGGTEHRVGRPSEQVSASPHSGESEVVINTLQVLDFPGDLEMSNSSIFTVN